MSTTVRLSLVLDSDSIAASDSFVKMAYYHFVVPLESARLLYIAITPRPIAVFALKHWGYHLRSTQLSA